MGDINDSHVTGAADPVKHPQQRVTNGTAFDGCENEWKIFRPFRNKAPHQKPDTKLRKHRQKEDDDNGHGILRVVREHESIEQDHRQQKLADDGLDRGAAIVVHQILSAHHDPDGKGNGNWQNHFNYGNYHTCIFFSLVFQNRLILIFLNYIINHGFWNEPYKKNFYNVFFFLIIEKIGYIPQKTTFVNRQYWWFFYLNFCVYCLSGFRIQGPVVSGQSREREEHMGSAMMDMMFRDACMNLSNGIVNPLDKDILSYAPLPDSVIDPYITQDVDPLQTMNLTNNTLKVWVEESKKANYFTTHFVTLSRMIMNGVATMARGLVTLHMRGEDLEQAPLSIQDLISISSYQFRKSYIGVLQTVKSKPEVSERLLMNQLRWNNTLIKLFKTREKLDSGIRIQELGNEEGRSKNEVQQLDVKSSEFKVQSSNSLDDEKALPEAEIKSIADPNVSNLSTASFDISSLESGSSEVSSLETDVSPLTELSELPALAAPAAYGAIRPYGPYRNQAGAGIKKLGIEEGRMKNEVQPADNEEGRSKNEVQRDVKSSESGSQEQGTRSMETGNEEGRGKNEIDSESSDSEIQEQESDREAMSCEESKESEENSSFFPHNSSFPKCPPEYARILYRALCRSSGNKDGTLEFTLEEINRLLADPLFCKYEPQLAADFRKALQSAEQ